MIHIDVLLTRPDSPQDKPYIYQYCFDGDFEHGVEAAAAWLNNIMMLIGGTTLEAFFFPEDISQSIRALLLEKYPQAVGVPSEYFLSPVQITFRPSSELGLVRYVHSSNKLPIRIARQNLKLQGLYAGINIGQTGLKMCLMENGAVIEDSLFYAETWPNPEQKNTGSLVMRLTSELDVMCSRANCDLGQVLGIGICIGGIVRENRIVTKSGVAADMTLQDFDEFSRIDSHISARLGIPCFVEQDVISKSFFAAAKAGRASCLVVDIGTSTGGALIDDDGNILDVIGQLGRVVIDTSPDALIRPDGMGRGGLSQYLSVKGLLHIAQTRGLRVTDPLDLERDLDSVALVQEVMNEFGDLLLRCVATVRSIWNFNTVLLTGGVMSGRLGSYLLTYANEKLESSNGDTETIRCVISEYPQYDAAAGVALLAGSLADSQILQR